MARIVEVLRELPVTVGSITVCVLLFLATTRPQQSQFDRLESLDRWGAVVDRPVTFGSSPPRTMFRAPLALWQGELWRIPVCAFHHVDWWHLLMNGVSAAYLGRLLERHWGSRRMLLFLPGAAFFPLLPEFLVGNYVLGYSGVIAAMFGALCVLRQTDEKLREELPDEAVYLGGAMLVSGLLFTWLEITPVANLAHMTGFFWGALSGCVTTGRPWGRPNAQWIRVGVIAASLGSLWVIMHPFRNGEYHWYLATKAGDLDERTRELRQAVDLQPDAVGAWLLLYGTEMFRGETMTAWTTLLTGLSHNPTDSRLLWQAQHVWRELVVSSRRAEAEQTIAEVFGKQAATWTAQLRSGPDRFSARTWEVTEVDPVAAYPLDRPVDLRLPELPNDADPAMMPGEPPPEGDAVEGRRM